MNNSTNAANSLNEFADFISKHEFAIILLIAAIFFFVFAVAKKLPLSEFETDSGIRKGFFLSFSPKRSSRKIDLSVLLGKG